MYRQGRGGQRLDQKASASVGRTADGVTALQRVRRRLALPARPGPAHRLLSTGLAQSPGLQCKAGFDGHFRQLSPAWAQTLGWSSRQLMGRPFIEFVHAADRGPLLEQLGKLARGGGAVEFEHRWLCQDGRHKWLHCQASSLPAHGGQFQAVLHDVTELKHLRRQLLDAADQERERMGRELHDGLCQNLAGIAALGSALSRRLAASGGAACISDLAEIGTLLNHAVVHVRDLAHGLCPAALRSAGIADALAKLADNVQALFGVACVFEGQPACPPLDAETALHLYRIAQQAVHNAIRHARGSRIDIVLGTADGAGFVSVRDDGAGMPELHCVPRSLGLQSMAYRAQLIGGALVVQRNTPRGTRVTCAFAWPQPLQSTPPGQGLT